MGYVLTETPADNFGDRHKESIQMISKNRGSTEHYLPRLMSPLSILYCHLVTLHALDFAPSCETLYLILYVDYAWSV